MKQQSPYALLLLTSLLFSLHPEAQTGNTKYGTGALLSNTTGSYNSAYGASALRLNTIGSRNTANGYQALYKNSSGRGNSAYGHEALYSNTTGLQNTALGEAAMKYNTSGSDNTAIGDGALWSNSTGNQNTASGFYALGYNTTGINNTASGYKALHLNKTGTRNVAFGHHTLSGNTTGSNNAALGAQALQSNTIGVENTASGYNALNRATSGSNNVASGAYALFNNTTGYYNTASGGYALYNNTTAYYNTASGYAALRTNTTGTQNTGSGHSALYANTTGSYNTASGYQALRLNTTGNYNTALGYTAGPSTTGLSNTTTLGYGASATASNQVRIGNNLVSSIGGYQNWSKLSDGRFKKNIVEDVPGLQFITQLRAVSYTVDIAGLDKALGGTGVSKPVEETAATALAAQEKHTGFIAQEVEETASKLNYAFSGVDKPKNDKDLYGLRYAEFVVPLVKAVQELDEKTQRIDALEKEVAELKAMVTRLANGQSVPTISLTSAFLEQNTPNPVTGTATIRYRVPQTATSARLIVTNAKGQLIKTILINNPGPGQVILNTSLFAAGTYNYTMYVDDKQAATKRLIIAK